MIRGIEQNTAHRPWPLPAGPWIMHQRWERLLFAHWPVPLEQLRPLVPPPLELDAYDGTGWVGIIPFRITRSRVRLLPSLPGLASFDELNVRTYVTAGGRAGVYFFSLDASSLTAVLGARTVYRLPYYHADMRVTERGHRTEYESRRRNGNADFSGRYEPLVSAAASYPSPGTLEHFLTERYALFTVSRGGTVIAADIHHMPWRVQPAEAGMERNTMAAAAGIQLPDVPPLLHYAALQDTLIWPPSRERIGTD